MLEFFPLQALTAYYNATLQLIGPICKLPKNEVLPINMAFVVQQGGVLHYNRLEKPATDKYSSLLVPFVSY